jgi:hypothetical protein
MAAARIRKLLSFADGHELTRSTGRSYRCSDAMRVKQCAVIKKEMKSSQRRLAVAAGTRRGQSDNAG